MKRLLIILWLLTAGPAHAALTQAELDRVAVDLPEGASLPLGLERPAVLIFADFDCGHICDAVLTQTADLLARTGLEAGRDYALTVVGLDPRDSARMAADFIARDAPPDMRDAITLLRPDAARLAEMTQALGYGLAYDAERDSFAHPAARYVLEPGGRVSAVLPAFGTDEGDLRRAIVGARLGTGAAATRLILLCYGFDPVTGRYSLAIWCVLTVLGLGTAALIGAGLALAHWRERRRA